MSNFHPLTYHCSWNTFPFVFHPLPCERKLKTVPKLRCTKFALGWQLQPEKVGRSFDISHSFQKCPHHLLLTNWVHCSCLFFFGGEVSPLPEIISPFTNVKRVVLGAYMGGQGLQTMKHMFCYHEANSTPFILLLLIMIYISYGHPSQQILKWHVKKQCVHHGSATFISSFCWKHWNLQTVLGLPYSASWAVAPTRIPAEMYCIQHIHTVYSILKE